MKKINTVLICIIAVCVLSAVIMLRFFPEYTYLIYNIRELPRLSGVEFFLPFTITELIFIIPLAVVVLAFNLAIICHRKKRSLINKIIIGAVSVFGILLISFTSIVYIFLVYDPEYYCFYSPDGEHSVIALEEPHVYTCNITFYKRTSPITIKKIGELYSDNHANPISASKYTAVWKDNVLEFTICPDTKYAETEIIELK